MIPILDKTAFVSVLTGGVPTTFSGFLFNGVASPAIRINIQPATPELTAMADGQFFKVYKGFTTQSGVVEGMRLTVSGTGEEYIVRGKERYDTLGHQNELVLEKGGV